jgi:hypothetical protein
MSDLKGYQCTSGYCIFCVKDEILKGRIASPHIESDNTDMHEALMVLAVSHANLQSSNYRCMIEYSPANRCGARCRLVRFWTNFKGSKMYFKSR